MSSKKIIVPQGLINPNETTIIEIPAGVESEATLIARSTPNHDDVPTPNTSRARRVTAGRSPSPPGGRSMRRLTSTTVIDQPHHDTSGQQQQGHQHGHGCCPCLNNSSMPNSAGGQTYSVNSTNNQSSTLGSGGGGGGGLYDYSSTFDSNSNYDSGLPFSPTGSSGMGMDGTRVINRNSPQNAGGNLTYTIENSSSSPQRMIKTTTSITTVTNEDDNSLGGMLGHGYQPGSRLENSPGMCDKSPMRYPSPAPGQDHSKRVKKYVKKVITETSGGENESYGGNRTPCPSMRQGGGMGQSNYMESPSRYGGGSPHQPRFAPRATSTPQSPQARQNDEVQRRLTEMEHNERTQINLDLSIFQQARRRLVEDTTNISATAESQIAFSPQ